MIAAAYGAGTGVLARRWLVTGGHRRYADEWARPLPTYRMLPVLLAGTAALVGWRLAPAGFAVATAYVVFVPLYGVLAAVDVDVHRLPDALTLPAYPLVAVALTPAVLQSATGPEAARRAALAGGAALASFAILHLASRRQLGLGDVKLAGSLGALLGWFSWARLLGGIYLMFLFGGGMAVWLLARRRADHRSALPFGPAMVLGAAVALVGGSPMPG